MLVWDGLMLAPTSADVVIDDNLEVFVGDNLCPGAVISWMNMRVDIDDLAIPFVLE